MVEIQNTVKAPKTFPEIWQPIASAPRDGTFVLTKSGPWQPCITHFATYDGRTRWGASPEDFMTEEEFLRYWHEVSYDPTEWMPLPDEDVADAIETAYRNGFEDGERHAADAPPSPLVMGYQDRVAQAHHALFHDDPTDVAERLARYAEETNEVLQAFGMSREYMHRLIDYTCDRPAGEPAKEIGAALLTLTSLCVVAGYDVMACAEADLEKLQRPETIARIRAKRSTRHGRGPLPGIDPAALTSADAKILTASLSSEDFDGNGTGSNGETLKKVCLNDPDSDPKNENIQPSVAHLLVPEGYALVPIEPTRAMWAAMANTLYGYKNRHHDKVAGDLYKAMLAAAAEGSDNG